MPYVDQPASDVTSLAMAAEAEDSTVSERSFHGFRTSFGIDSVATFGLSYPLVLTSLAIFLLVGFVSRCLRRIRRRASPTLDAALVEWRHLWRRVA